MSIEERLHALAERWREVPAAERANAHIYLIELCEALDVPRPQPRGSGYEFEFPISVVNPDGSITPKSADLYKRGFFLLEAKDESAKESRDVLMRRAFGQARLYAAWLPDEPPPYLLALDVGTTLMVWDRWSGAYRDFHSGYRIHLPTLADRPEDIALLRDIWTNPAARDPRGRSEAVTREVAAKLAKLAAALEERGHDPEVVARFLIRCVFTMFAEDVDLLKGEPFRRAISEIGLEDPEEFQTAVAELWAAMDEGRRFGIRKFLRFNGHFFRDQTALPLTRADLEVLLEAARADWSEVEPAIMGTLLTRALDPTERHRLGAEYTPREYVERVVRPTVEEPIRERWTQVQAEVLQLRSVNGKGPRVRKRDEKKALTRLREFHGWLRGLRFLDPACGSGNFLYVTLNLVKQVELEVVRAIEEITGHPELAVEEVGPWQFHGIEVKAWARELAELTLWVGYHQWWRRTHGHTQPPEPVLRDTGTLEHRDAVLAWEEIVHRPEKDRPDPTPRIPDPVTGNLVPDPEAKLQYLEYVGARPAPWPEADFIVGNPPYLGKSLMRSEFGDGYVEALRSAYVSVPRGADYVMYWWHRAATSVASGRTIRAGMITTNSIRQPINRSVVAAGAEAGAKVIWSIPDHPWVDEVGSADVTVAMTVMARTAPEAIRLEVDAKGHMLREVRVKQLNPDLTAHADVGGTAAQSLRSNSGLAANGFLVYGRGFILDAVEAVQLLLTPADADLIRPVRNGRDLTARPRELYVIDFGLRDEAEARAHPVLYDIVRSRVKPYRDTVKDRSRRENWWRFGRTNEALRGALQGVSRFIATPYVSKHRFFTYLDVPVVAEDSVVCIALEDAYFLGVLSSRVHVEWALVAGGRLGVGNDPRYNKTRCFDPFPFPDPSPDLRTRLSDLAERLDEHRKTALGRDERVTMTGMYNVLEKLRSGEPLSKREREVHEMAACGILRDLHDELDKLVAQAYGWPWPMEREEILARLVALHDERVEEEKRGIVRWLRPDYQIPKFGFPDQARPELDLVTVAATPDTTLPAWPADAAGQISAIQELLERGPVSIESAVAAFDGPNRDLVARHLETLEIMGVIQRSPEGLYQLMPRAVA